jgi:hypothetical protein
VRDRGGDQRGDLGVVEDGGGREADVAALPALALEQAVGVGERGAIVEIEEDSAGIDRERDGDVAGARGGGIADRERVVVVVDQLERAGEAAAQFGAGGADEARDLRGEASDEGLELRLGVGGGFGWLGHASSDWIRFADFHPMH